MTRRSCFDLPLVCLSALVLLPSDCVRLVQLLLSHVDAVSYYDCYLFLHFVMFRFVRWHRNCYTYNYHLPSWCVSLAFV